MLSGHVAETARTAGGGENMKANYVRVWYQDPDGHRYYEDLELSDGESMDVLSIEAYYEEAQG